VKIAIAGYGVEGKASYEYWNTGEHELTIADERTDVETPDGTKTILGEGAFKQLGGFDLVVRTASLPPRHIHTDGVIWSATNEFFAKCPAPIIGVTGTKGKGTTCSMIASILKAVGKTVHLVGNIGTPALEILPTIKEEDIVVFELSSFQLWDIKKSPHVGVVLTIEPDHLNVHSDMPEYISAKTNIARFQTVDDAFFYHPTNTYSEAIALTTPAHINCRYNDAEDRASVYYDAHDFCYKGKPICSLDALQLRGEHNKENACAALSVAKYLGVENMVIEEGLRNFMGLPHRLEFVQEAAGVQYYNDSFSSAPSASVAAIKSFMNPEIVIIGGVDKGADFSELAKQLKTQSNIKNIILVGEIRTKLAKIFITGVSDKLIVSDAKTMDEIVYEAQKLAEPGDVVLLSPGCASFDMFKNFYDRGDQFRSIVHNL
jgi:UDP-N-acetylmuramoylalanine--D-glutamate ligase